MADGSCFFPVYHIEQYNGQPFPELAIHLLDYFYGYCDQGARTTYTGCSRKSEFNCIEHTASPLGDVTQINRCM